MRLQIEAGILLTDTEQDFETIEEVSAGQRVMHFASHLSHVDKATIFVTGNFVFK